MIKKLSCSSSKTLKTFGLFAFLLISVLKLKNLKKYDVSQDSLVSVLFNTVKIRAFSLAKIPLIFYVKPVIEEVNASKCVIRIPLIKRNKNHLNSMYFGTLSVGADLAGGLIAMNAIQKSKQSISLVFKDFNAEFYKRPNSDVFFVCEDGPAIQNQIKEAIETGERVNLPVTINALVKGDTEPVAKFVLTLSLKKKNKK